jgi:Helix-turn-helix domain
MSSEATRWARSRKTGHVGRKCLLMIIADYADKNGANAFPDQETLADQAEQDKRTVRRHLAQLVTDGHLDRHRRYDRNGHRKSDVYTLSLTDIVVSGRPSGQKRRSLPDKKARSLPDKALYPDSPKRIPLKKESRSIERDTRARKSTPFFGWDERYLQIASSHHGIDDEDVTDLLWVEFRDLVWDCSSEDWLETWSTFVAKEGAEAIAWVAAERNKRHDQVVDEGSHDQVVDHHNAALPVTIENKPEPPAQQQLSYYDVQRAGADERRERYDREKQAPEPEVCKPSQARRDEQAEDARKATGAGGLSKRRRR